VLAESALPAWQPHPEIWLLIAGLIALGLYTSRVIQPTVVARGGKPITAAQKRWFLLGVALLWLVSDWPIHDVSEERLYSVHMFQHLVYSVVVPPIMLLATPEWLGRLILGEGRLKRWFPRLARPLPAAIGYNVVVAFTHWTWAVNTSIESGPLHYTFHVLVVGTALLAWVPVCGPFPEMRVSPPAQMVHIFLLSVIPTIPSSWLTAAEGVVYKGYDHGPDHEADRWLLPVGPDPRDLLPLGGQGPDALEPVPREARDAGRGRVSGRGPSGTAKQPARVARPPTRPAPATTSHGRAGRGSATR
jgi:putative membrane protein